MDVNGKAIAPGHLLTAALWHGSPKLGAQSLFLFRGQLQMSYPSRRGKVTKTGQVDGRNDLRQAGIALVHELCEPLAAIENYREAVICLHAPDTPAARIKLGEVCEKSQTD